MNFMSATSLAALRAEAARIDADFARQERAASAELQAVRMRNAITKSNAILSRFSIEVPKAETPDPFAPSVRG